MANKRIKKKRQKLAEIKKLNSAGYSAKQIKSFDDNFYKKELKRVTRNEQQRERRARYVAGWEQIGIDKKIISRLGLRNKNPDNISAKELREIKNKQKAYRANETRNLNSKVYKANTHLALAFTPLNGADVWSTEQLKKYSYSTLLKKIKSRRKEAAENPDGSNGLRGAFEIMSGNKEDCTEMLQDFSERGYNLKIGKLTREQYMPLVNRNDWTRREFAEMVLCVTAQCPNADVEKHMQAFENFVEENNLPFTDIFE